jgi:putative hydrolase of the HAD superfamily
VVAPRRFTGLILDFFGVLTTNMVEVIELFEAREHLRPGTFLTKWACDEGQELYRRLELGEISQRSWNDGFAALLGISGDNLMGRLLFFLDPAHDVLKVARQARAAGIRTAVLSNSLGHDPHDPYARYNLSTLFDVVVMSDECALRKPDPAIFQLTLDKLSVTAASCVLADDTEENLRTADAMGMTVVYALDEQETAARLRALFGLAGRLTGGLLQEVPDRWRSGVSGELCSQAGQSRSGSRRVHPAHALDRMGRSGERPVQVVQSKVGLSCSGQVDGVAAGVLVVSPVVRADRRVETPYRLGGVAEVERG